jgi:deoxyribodipyrimidine photo-lyase
VAASGDYDAYARQRDLKVSCLLPFRHLRDSYIFSPDEVLKADQSPYLVFTPFYNRAKALFTAEHMKAYPFVPQQLFPASNEGIVQISQGKETLLSLEISSLGFAEQKLCLEKPEVKLQRLKQQLKNYAMQRDFPSQQASSQLSVDLRFGTISVRELLRFLSAQKKEGIETEPFFRQLLFRDFYAYLLYHFPRIEKENYKYRFTGVEDREKYEAFCRGETGVPFVDAGVNELLQTGTMHNRLRMVCASFFTKDLLLPWQWGEAFFAKHLLDYDAASNILSWQWSAGTGIDPQPYFRIFNPYLQAKKFDKEALYIKRFCPELKEVPPKLLHDEEYLLSHAIAGYPKPILRHKEASAAALAYFKRSVV